MTNDSVMGTALPMFLSVHLSMRPFLRFAICLLAAFMVLANAGVCHAEENAAQSADVQTYTNQAVPSNAPDADLWNRPLKAGELKLEKRDTNITVQPLPAVKPKIADKLVAPQLGGTATTAPVLTAPQTSSASVMLMQGMKNAMQQIGENPTLPKSQMVPVEASSSPAPVLQPPAISKTASGVTYQTGQEPHNLANGKALESSPETSVKEAAPTNTETVPMPKATELEQVPVPLDQIPAKPGVETATDTESSSSVFGAPVAEATSEKTQAKPADDSFGRETATKPAAAAATPVSGQSCEPKTSSWEKTCSDAGYPASFAGKITGETRTVCPSGDLQDVWLSNTCAASGSTSVATPAAIGASVIESAAEPRATDMPVSPKSLGDDSANVAGVAASLEPEHAAQMDASCGAANGLASNGKPAADLCAFGEATEVSGEGPWHWSCKGISGGMTVSCAAPVATISKTTATHTLSGSIAKAALSAENGKCGAANGAGADTVPSANLCIQGIASRVNGGGPWTWACSGTNGGQAAACSASKKTDGACGSADNNGTETMPQRDLCAAGFASAITGNGPWNWTCSGLYGGAAATCSASPKVNAVCGSASLTGHHAAPTDNLCTIGTASSIGGDGPWHWTCAGNNGGAAVTCNAPTVMDGACGGANGGSFEKAPDDELCTQGKATRVTGLGPWNWSCAGLDGGNSASCTASLVGKPSPAPLTKSDASSAVSCGAASEAVAFQTPTQNLCAAGTASSVAGSGPWNWSCSDDAGHTQSCSTLGASEGVCGTATNVPSAQKPSVSLCVNGTPTDVASDKKDANWTWTCEGSLGAAGVSCTAPIAHSVATKAPDEAKCGVASGVGVTSAPSSDLCETGKASKLRGSGPWNWTCATKAKQKVSCEAPKIEDGVCGLNNGAVLKSAPASGLCSSGTPTDISGDGPWLWSCVGAGGGASSSCSAMAQSQTKVDGTCGAASSNTMTSMPTANLCDSGVASRVYGEGPWTWTCSGLNGGIASSCQTAKVKPQAPPPPGPSVNGNCGSANGLAALTQPTEGLCSSGTVTEVSGNGPWNWNCLASNGGMTVSCTAPLVPPAPIVGVCGSANGVTTMTTPRSGLCSAGISSAVSGKGPWTWSCSGTNGGGAVGCVAPVAGNNGMMGVPSLSSPTEHPFMKGDNNEAPAPKAAPIGLVTPRLPSGSLPPMESGTLPQLQPSKPFPALTTPSAPPAASTWSDVVQPPTQAPELPAGTQNLAPPPVRDTLPPSPALQGSNPDGAGSPVPGARLKLDEDVSTFGFTRGSDQLEPATVTAMNKLAGILQNNGNVRITLTAYADNNGSTPREARRLSLARALNLRDYLTAKGISSSRIDVRALGANVPSGDMDRVDVKVN